MCACNGAAAPEPPATAPGAQAVAEGGGPGSGATTPHDGPALWFGGDVHLGGKAGTVGPLAEALAGAAGVVNLEGPLGERGGSWLVEGGVRLANPPDAGARLAAMGVVAAGVVNNHRDDEGEAGRRRTEAGLGAAGVVPVGDEPAELVVGGRVVVLHAGEVGGAMGAGAAAARSTTGGGLEQGAAGPDGDAVARRGDGVDAATTALAARVAAVERDRPGVVQVVGLHVTGPPSYLPGPALVAAVDAVVGAGADVVVAHGSHALGPVERRGGAVVAWGLGNLLFDCPCTDAEEALVLRVELSEGLPATVLPVRAGLGGRDARPAPEPAGVLDLLDAIGSVGLRREGGVGRF